MLRFWITPTQPRTRRLLYLCGLRHTCNRTVSGLPDDRLRHIRDPTDQVLA